MSNELAVLEQGEVVDLENVSYEQLMAMTGQEADEKSVSGLPRVTANVKSEMTIQKDGKEVRVEVPYKTWKFNHPEHGWVFLKNPKVRIFVNRFMYTRYDEVEKKTSNYSVMINDWKKEEAPDISGSVNCGKFQGFIESKIWDEMSEAEKKFQRGARRVRVVLGTISGKAMGIGEEEYEIENMPVRFDFGGDSLKNVGDVIADATNKRVGLPFLNITFGLEVKEVGATTFGVVVPTPLWADKPKSDAKDDVELLKMFLELVIQHNNSVMTKHKAQQSEEYKDDDSVDAGSFGVQTD